jgi:hypothetical protein
LGFLGKQGILFGLDESQAKTCMDYSTTIIVESFNSSDSYQFAAKNDNDFSSAPADQFGDYFENSGSSDIRLGVH